MPNKPDLDQERDWRILLTPNAADPSVFSEGTQEALKIIASVPDTFKGNYAGQIVAWIPSQIVASHLINADAEHSKRFAEVMCDKSECPLPEGLKCDATPHDLPVPTNEPYRHSVTTGNHDRLDMLLIRAPVREPPFVLVLAVPAAEIVGHTAPWHLLLAMGVLAVTVLIGTARLVRVNTRSLVLQTRLEESSRRESEIGEKNMQLEEEIAQRKTPSRRSG